MREQISRAVATIKEELAERLKELRDNHQLLEAQRLEQRTNYDIEMLLEIKYRVIENYFLVKAMVDVQTNPLHTLLDFFPKDSLFVVDGILRCHKFAAWARGPCS